MKRATLIVGLVYLWTFLASLWFCFFDFRLFRFPFLQWWEGLFYVRNMLWLPRFRDFGHWPLLWFVAGFVVASLAISVVARPLLPRRIRQPKLYGESRIALPRDMAAGGITTEKR